MAMITGAGQMSCALVTQLPIVVMNRFKIYIWRVRRPRKADIITGVFQNGWMGIGREGLEWNGRGQLRRFPPLIVVVVPNCRPEFDLGEF